MSALASINLSKGANISLAKQDPNIKKAMIGLQWNPRTTVGVDFDLDACAFLVDATGKVRKVTDFIFYKNLQNANGSVVHTGDNRTGAGDGDDEVITVDLDKVPAEIQKIIFTVTIHDAEKNNQNFGQVPSSMIRIANKETVDAWVAANPGQDSSVSKVGELARYDLQEEYSTETAMVCGELYRNNGEWKFRGVGQGYSGGLQAMVNEYVDPSAT